MYYSIIAIGSRACRIARCFEQFKRYKIFYVISEKIFYKKGKRILLPKFKTMEEYEEFNCDYDKSFKTCSVNIYVIVTGGHRINGCILRLLYSLKNNNISIIFLKENIVFKQNSFEIKRQELVYGILQEYTKSTLFKKIFVYEDKLLQKTIGNVPILEVEQKINNLISYTIDTYNFFKNNVPIYKHDVQVNEQRLISSISLYNFKQNEEINFFPLDFLFGKDYHLGISKRNLQEDTTLLGKLNSLLDENSNFNVSYFVYPLEIEEKGEIAICVNKSQFIQK